MAYRGKIAFHFPNRSPNPNFDANNIKFLPAGITNPSSNDLVQVNKVYAIPAGVTITSVADLQNYVVWELINSLVAGNQNVAIEYVPKQDTILSSISIFTASGNNQTQTSVRVSVVHESGLGVSKGTSDTVSPATLYGLTGYKHTITYLNNNKLFKGQKYYIIYQGSSNNDFYPAYFDTTGNYKDSITIQSDIEIERYYSIETGTDATFFGVLTNSMPIFNMREGQWFAWANGYGAGLSKYRMYKRTNVGSQYNFEGVVGYPDNSPEFGYAQAVQLIEKSQTGDFIWYCAQQCPPNLTHGDIYTKDKSSGTIYTTANTVAVDVANETDVNNQYFSLAKIFYGLTQKNYIITGGGNYHYRRMGGYVMSIKSPYISKTTSTEPLTTEPSNKQTNEIYYLSNTISGINNTAPYLWDGSSWQEINYGNFGTYLNYSELSQEVLTRVGSNSDLLEEVKVDGDSVDVEWSCQGCFDASVVTTKKFYLEINGQEV